jgi:hypothetical protein
VATIRKRGTRCRYRSAFGDILHTRNHLHTRPMPGRAAIANLPLDKLTPSTLVRLRDEYLLVVFGASVRRELAILQHCLEVAREEWGVCYAIPWRL